MFGIGQHTLELTPGQDTVRIQTLAYPVSSVRLWQRTDKFLVLKIAGHRYQSNSLQSQAYASAEFQVWEILNTKRYDNGGKEDIDAVVVLRFPVNIR